MANATSGAEGEETHVDAGTAQATALLIYQVHGGGVNLEGICTRRSQDQRECNRRWVEIRNACTPCFYVHRHSLDEKASRLDESIVVHRIADPIQIHCSNHQTLSQFSSRLASSMSITCKAICSTSIFGLTLTFPAAATASSATFSISS